MWHNLQPPQRDPSAVLTQLTISNFAIIRLLKIHFRPGLNILSGETGAGKSIIINAVNLILGGRASLDLIRSGSDEARVEALFRVPESSLVSSLLSELGLPFEGQLLIRRTISRGGRNRITINDAMVTLQTLTRIGPLLISISGQHEHQLLLRAENHLYLLDEFGGLSQERSRLAQAFGRYQALKEELLALEREIRAQEEREELRRFQIREIESARIKEGEDRLLEEERKRLRHAGQLLEIIAGARQRIYENEDSVLSDIARCIKGMEKAEDMDPRIGNIKQTLLSAKVELEEAALELRDMQNTIRADPLRQEEVEDRLHLLNRLKRKYGPSLEEVMAFKDRLSRMADDLEEKKRGVRGICEALKEMEKEVLALAGQLSGKRKKAAKRLEKSVESELNLLQMGGTRFRVHFQEGPGGDAQALMGAVAADGWDRVEFLLSPNVGEELRPLSRIASGGELSRIMLAMKTILARTGSVETLIFDEVDSGIGGATAEVVGEKLQSLAGYHQILCITHLPQIASKGETHFLVEKRVQDERVQTTISELDPEQRVREIARLLGGRVISPQALAHAREMMG